ncbi:MAG: cupin domain-containing protein [Chloroflexi bacterium]|nr:cupin domain-containing protein [Chloroflexota bacterium]
MIVRNEEKRHVEMAPGVKRCVLSHGDRLMVVEIHLAKGAVVAQHAHPHEQASYMVRGSLRFTVDGRQFTLNEGESCLIPSGAMHGVTAETDCLALDSFSPPREDFLA